LSRLKFFSEIDHHAALLIIINAIFEKCIKRNEVRELVLVEIRSPSYAVFFLMTLLAGWFLMNHILAMKVFTLVARGQLLAGNAWVFLGLFILQNPLGAYIRLLGLNPVLFFGK